MCSSDLAAPGEGTSPALNWTNAPAGTKCFVLHMHDLEVARKVAYAAGLRELARLEGLGWTPGSVTTDLRASLERLRNKAAERAASLLSANPELARSRRDAKGFNGLLGTAKSPYKEWKWADVGARVGGPNFVELADGRLIGVVLGVFAIAGVITRFALPALLAHGSAERVMAGCLLFAAVAFAGFPLSTNLYFMLAFSFLLGLGLGCGQPLSMSIGFNRSPEGRAGEVTGLRLSANNLARVIIPVVCGALGGAFGAAPVFVVNAFNLTAISYALWRQ